MYELIASDPPILAINGLFYFTNLRGKKIHAILSCIPWIQEKSSIFLCVHWLFAFPLLFPLLICLLDGLPFSYWLQIFYIYLVVNSLCLNVCQVFFHRLSLPLNIPCGIFSHINKFYMLIESYFPYMYSLWVMF